MKKLNLLMILVFVVQGFFTSCTSAPLSQTKDVSTIQEPQDPPNTKSRIQLSDFAFTFQFHALEKEMATHSSVLVWRIPGMGELGGLLSMGSLTRVLQKQVRLHYRDCRQAFLHLRIDW